MKTKKEKIRPLGLFSDFIIDDFPRLLETPSLSSQEILDALELLPADEVIRNHNELEVALLDLKLYECGIVHSGLTPPESLVMRIDKLSKHSIGALTYEDIILINPAGDMRLFTRGDTGGAEAAFYIGHAQVEESLANIIVSVIEAMETMQNDAVAACNPFADIENHISAIHEVMHAMHGMNKEHFATFRTYLGSHPLRKKKGPSGAFTAKIPIVELLFRESVPADYLAYIEDNRPYFPKRDIGALDTAIECFRKGMTLIRLWKIQGEIREIERGILLTGQFLNQFRLKHYSAVAKQLPEAISGKIAGTGGEENPGAFLRHRIKSMKFTMAENNRVSSLS